MCEIYLIYHALTLVISYIKFQLFARSETNRVCAYTKWLVFAQEKAKNISSPTEIGGFIQTSLDPLDMHLH